MLVPVLEPRLRLERALSSLRLAYQPIVDWSARRVVAYEALVRGREPGLRRPRAILRHAGAHGLIPLVGRRVRALAAGAVEALPAAVALHVNLHPVELSDRALYRAAPALAGRVVLELTEEPRGTGVAAQRAAFVALRRLGYRLALDDLGAGHHDAALLHALRPDIAKLDRSLVRGCARDRRRRRRLASLCREARELGVELVAEGIEDEDDREAVLTAGCDRFQGFLFGKPRGRLP